MILLVTGGRDFDDKERVRRALRDYAQPGNILISGGADGWDYLCEQVWGGEYQLPYVVVPAPWDRMGKAAGPARNLHMLSGNSIAPYAELVPDLVVAGPGGAGTRHCIEQAERLGIQVIRQ